MGTRHLTCVVVDGKFRLANYGQWDGYPSSQGITTLEFIRDKFKPEFIFEQLPKIKEPPETLVKEVSDKIGSKDGWMTDKQFKQWKTYFPYIDRNLGAKILEIIQNCQDEVIYINNAIEFAADSLFCEWAYVIDFDTRTFEVYTGFKEEPLTENDRFYFLNDKDSKYYPIKLAKSYSLLTLPTNEQFLADFKKDEE